MGRTPKYTHKGKSCVILEGETLTAVDKLRRSHVYTHLPTIKQVVSDAVLAYEVHIDSKKRKAMGLMVEEGK